MGALLIFMPGYISLMTYFLIVGGFSLFGLMASISSISHYDSMSAIIYGPIFIATIIGVGIRSILLTRKDDYFSQDRL